MILSDEEINRRLSAPENLCNSLKSQDNTPKSNIEIVPIGKQGRTEGSTGIPPKVQELIGTLAHTSDSTQSEIAEQFGVSSYSVSHLKRGLVGNRFNPELRQTIDVNKSSIDVKKDQAHESALDNLMDTMAALKLRIPQVTKAKDLSKIASDMSRVVVNLKNKKEDEDERKSNVVVILHKPVQNREDQYEAIEA